MKKLFLLFTAVAASACTVQAQTPMLVSDIYPGATGSDPTQLSVYNSKLYFAADDVAAGRELFMYDGVTPPSLAYNTNPGLADGLSASYDEKMGVLNGKLYFAGDDGTHGFELMSYNGVGAPTLVADLVVGAGGSNVSDIKVIGSRLYFSATTPANGYELYVYDGINPPVLQDINAGILNSYPSGFTKFNNKIYFTATKASVGRELFMYDTATNSVSLAADINVGASNSYASFFNIIGSKMYLYASTAANGAELFSYDGTTATRVSDLNPGAGNGIITAPTEWKGIIYFAGSPTGTNSQLYKFDPSTGNTTLVYNIDPGNDARPDVIAIYNGLMYFTAYTAANGQELWVYDGTNPPTLVADLFPGTSNSGMSDFQEFNGTLYFNAYSSGTNYELYSLKTIATGINAVRLAGSFAVAPNPTNGNTNFSLDLSAPQQCSITVTDAAGKIIWTVPETNYTTGKHQITLPLDGYAAGLYYYQLADANGKTLAAGGVVKQ